MVKNKEQPRRQRATLSWSGLLVACLLGTFALLAPLYTLLPIFLPTHADWLDSDLPQDEKLQRLAKMTSPERVKEISRQSKRFADAPLDADRLYYLAILYSLEKNEAKAKTFGKLASERSLHATKLQLLGINLAFGRKDYSYVANAFDGLIRINLKNRDAYFEFVDSLLRTEDAIPALAGVLAHNPPWRENYITTAATRKSVQKSLLTLFAQLRKLKSPPTGAELSSLVVSLTRDGNYDASYFIWLDSLTTEELSLANLLFDGDFDRPVSNLIFGWNFLSQKNLEIRTAPGTDNKDKALRIAMFNTEGFRNVYQFLKLNPGVYVLKGDGKAESLKTEGALAWRVSCAKSGQQLGEGGSITTIQPWTEFKLDFTVPEDGCDTQVLRLEATGTAAVEQKFSGTIYFDKFAIQSVKQ
jgi:hypothetical protein